MSRTYFKEVNIAIDSYSGEFDLGRVEAQRLKDLVRGDPPKTSKEAERYLTIIENKLKLIHSEEAE